MTDNTYELLRLPGLTLEGHVDMDELLGLQHIENSTRQSLGTITVSRLVSVDYKEDYINGRRTALVSESGNQLHATMEVDELSVVTTVTTKAKRGNPLQETSTNFVVKGLLTPFFYGVDPRRVTVVELVEPTNRHNVQISYHH